jgi:transcriptional regulator with XRE-family HTH domain
MRFLAALSSRWGAFHVQQHPAMTRTEMGQRIRLIRLALRLTQRQMAAYIDARQSKICDIEKGKQWPVFEDIGKLALALHFSLDVLNAPGDFDLKACLHPR